jgi:WD40 repeat protein
MIKLGGQQSFQPTWTGRLSDFVTAIAYAPDGKSFAASSAAGEVIWWQQNSGLEPLTLLPANNSCSVDCLAFSQDGQFLAVGGQSGQVHIWQIRSANPELLLTLGNSTDWIDRLAWSPTQNLLAFSLGKYVQVWEAASGEIATTLNFHDSSALDITWHPDGKRLTVGGYQGVKIWTANDWDDDPYLLTIPSASMAVAWSPDGKYIASGNLDRTITVLEWNETYTTSDAAAIAPDKPLAPWVMRGFPSKIRQLVWSTVFTAIGAPLLAAASAEGLVVWEKQDDEAQGWEGRVLPGHEEPIQAIQFQPNSLFLASAASDSRLCFWQKAKRLIQSINGAPGGFSCLAWQPQGYQLAVGSQNGDLLLLAKTTRGQGFG